jgi:hypothetical protein
VFLLCDRGRPITQDRMIQIGFPSSGAVRTTFLRREARQMAVPIVLAGNTHSVEII